jgi:TRAP-type C4-dicarboxylate transport system substrate-binding protein
MHIQRMKNLMVLFTVLLFACSDSQQGNTDKGQNTSKIVWDMPTPYVDGVFHTENIKHFAKNVESMSMGEVSIKIHSGASLYKLPEIKQAVRSNQVPIGEILMSSLGNENPIFQVDTIPLLANSYDKAEKLWEASRPKIEELLDKQGLKLLFAVPWPPQGLYSKKSVSGIEDLKGLKIRAYNPMLTRLAELMGGTPVVVQTPEIPQAFSTGIINTMITSPSTGVSSQAWDYIEYYYDFQAWLPKNMVIVNKSAFENLSQKNQEVILSNAAEAEKQGWTMSKMETIEKTKILRDNGVTVMDPSLEFWSSLMKIRQQLVAEWLIESGAEGREILKKYKGLLDKMETLWLDDKMIFF